MNEGMRPFPLDYEKRRDLMSKGKIEPAKYELKFMFDWGACSCLWGVDKAAIEKFGAGPIDFEELPLSVELKERLKELCATHDEALDWDCPQNGLVWDWKKQNIFREKARLACWDIIHELGQDYGVSWDKNCII